MRSLIPLHLVQAILALANPSTTAIDEAGGLSCPASAGHAGQTPFVWRLGLDHPRCLRGEETVALVDTEPESFESFEEWKARQAADVSSSATREAKAAVDNKTLSSSLSPPDASEPAETKPDVPPPPAPPPPIEKKGHRYNYASPDCSSRVLSSSPSTQHASSLLHKSKDRYMLTPCKAEQHYVVVELCDEIRIQAIEIAVWEFFSGVVRNIRLSVGGEENEDWKVVGDWIGKNVRGVQTFTLPEPTSFHRFIRLDFPSYYGTEYYCPVSQLKVYGLNQMEAFKVEQARSAEAVREEDQAQKERERQLVQDAMHKIEEERRAREAREREEETKREQELCELEKLVQAQARRGRELEYEEIIQCAPASSADTATAAPVSALASTGNGSGGPDAPNANATAASSAPPLPSAKRDSSESIYAHIVRRLAALEGNGTLVARFIDEQAKALRSAVARIEAVQASLLSARSESERAHTSALAAQDARLHRLLTQVEYLKMAYESDRRAAQAQLRALANELGFERRKSIAQLVILIGLVGGALFSKSAAIEQLLRPLQTSARHGKKLSSGPLAGLVIDVATPRAAPGPPPWEREPWAYAGDRASPTSPVGRTRKKSSRPNTPTLQHLKRRALAQRSISMISGDEEQLPPRSKLRSAHLHPLKRADGEVSPGLPARSPVRSPVASHASHLRSPRAPRLTPTPSRRRRFPADVGDESQWDTSLNNTSASASEPASASEASDQLGASEEEEYNGIGGLHLRDSRWEEASFST